MGELSQTLSLRQDSSFNQVINDSTNKLGQLQAQAVATGQAIQQMAKAPVTAPAGNSAAALAAWRASLPAPVVSIYQPGSGGTPAAAGPAALIPFRLGGGLATNPNAPPPGSVPLPAPTGPNPILRNFQPGTGSASGGDDIKTMTSLMGPLGLAAGGVVAVYEEIRKQQEIIKQSLQTMFDAGSMQAKNFFQAIGEASRETEAQLNNFHDDLAHIGDTFDEVAHHAQQELALIHDRAEATKLLNQQDEERYNGMLEQAKALGQISSLQEQIGKQQVTASAFKTNLQAEGDKERAEIANALSLAVKEKARKEHYEYFANKSIEEGKDPLTAITTQKKTLAENERQLEKARQELDEAKADALKGFLWNDPTGTYRRGIAKADENKYQTLLGTVEAQRDHLAGLENANYSPQRQKERNIASAKQAEEERQKAERAAKDLSERHEQGEKARAELGTKFDAAQKIRAENAALDFMGQNKPNLGATSIEKMGFVFGGGGGPSILADHARVTAMNTAKMVAQLDLIVAAMQHGNAQMLWNRS